MRNNSYNRNAGVPMTAEAYEVAATELERLAAVIRNNKGRRTAQERRTMTQAVTNARRYARKIECQHNGWPHTLFFEGTRAHHAGLTERQANKRAKA